MELITALYGKGVKGYKEISGIGNSELGISQVFKNDVKSYK